MAVFNPDQQSVNIPSGLGYSNLSGSAPGGGLLKTLAAGLDSAVKFGDSVIDQSIKRDVTAAVDKVHELYGADAATPDPNDENLPPSLKQGMTRLDILNAAYQTGVAKESHMLGLLNAKLKEIKSRFPGYEDHVDKWMASKGYQPANQLVAQLRQEALAELTNRDAAARDRLNFIQSHTAELNIAFGEDFFSNPEKYNMPMEAMLQGVSRVTAKKAQIEQLNAAYTALEHEGKATAADAERHARKSTEAFMQISSAAWGDNFAKKISEFQKSGGTIDPQEQQVLMQEFSYRKQQLATGLQQYLSKVGSWYKLDEATRKDIMASATAQLDIIEQSLFNKDYGMVEWAAKMSKALMDDEVLFQMGKDPIRRGSALRQILGETGFGILLSKDLGGIESAIADSILTQVIDGGGAGAISGTGADMSLKGTFENWDRFEKQGYRLNNDLYKVFIDTNLALLASPDTRPEAKSRIIQYMFGKNDSSFLELFNKETSPKVYATMVNPMTTKAIKALGDDQAWKNYTTWAYRSFQKVVQEQASEIKSQPASFLDNYVLRYNASTNQVDVVPTGEPLGERDPGDQASIEYIVKTRVRGLNLALASIKTVAKEDGSDLGMMVRSTLQLAGVPMITNDDERGSQIDTEGHREDLRGSMGRDDLEDSTLDTSALLDFIGQAEGAGYNTMYGETPDQPQYSLTNMTINEVMQLQRDVGGSGAAGKYQIQRATLSWLKKELGLSGDEWFTPEMQDTLAQVLLYRRGLGEFQKGKLSKEQLATNLSREWASLPDPRTGKSYWTGVGGNRNLVSSDEILTQLAGLGANDNYTPNFQGFNVYGPNAVYGISGGTVMEQLGPRKTKPPTPSNDNSPVRRIM